MPTHCSYLIAAYLAKDFSVMFCIYALIYVLKACSKV